MDHTLALIIKSQQGDKKARDTVFEENTGLIYSVAKRFVGRGVEMEDLIQIGSIGLLTFKIPSSRRYLLISPAIIGIMYYSGNFEISFIQ